MSKELATQDAPALPDLYGTTGGTDGPTLDEIQLPSIYVIQELSDMAKSRVAAPGSVVYALGSDDPAPSFLIDYDANPKGTFSGYIVGRDKFVARTEPSQSMEWLPKNYVRDPGERDVWVGYFFYFAIPEVDEHLPARWMLWRTAGTPVFRKLNTFIAMAQANGSNDPIRVEFSVQSKTGTKSGKQYYAVAPKPVKADPEHRDIVLAQASLVTALNNRFDGGSSATPGAAVDDTTF